MVTFPGRGSLNQAIRVIAIGTFCIGPHVLHWILKRLRDHEQRTGRTLACLALPQEISRDARVRSMLKDSLEQVPAMVEVGQGR